MASSGSYGLNGGGRNTTFSWSLSSQSIAGNNSTIGCGGMLTGLEQRGLPRHRQNYGLMDHKYLRTAIILDARCMVAGRRPDQ